MDNPPPSDPQDLNRRLAADAAARAKEAYDLIEPALRAAEHVGQTMTAAAAFLQRVDQGRRDAVAWWARTLDDARRWHEASEKVLQLLAPRGWLLSPILPATSPFDLLALYEKEGIEGVERELVDTFDPSACQEIIESLTGRESFARWAPTFRKAIGAHRKGDYELAIPIWLIAIDGICNIEFLGIDVYRFQSPTGKVARRLRNTLTAGMAYSEPEIDAMLQVFVGLGLKPQPAVLNRNHVLHGEVPVIGDEKDSIQCVVVLHVLYWLLSINQLDDPVLRS